MNDWQDGLAEAIITTAHAGGGAGALRAAMLVHPPKVALATLLDVQRSRARLRCPVRVAIYRLRQLGRGERRFLPSDQHLDEAARRIAKWYRRTQTTEPKRGGQW